MAEIVMVGGDRVEVAGTADGIVAALDSARREEFCSFDGPNGTIHVNPDQVAYVKESQETGLDPSTGTD